MTRWMIAIAGVLGLLGVMVGAFAAHGLPNRLSEQGVASEEIQRRVENCETGAKYHMLHALTILALGLSSIAGVQRRKQAAALFLLLGITLFSGGLYSISLLGIMGHWAIVPAGGLCFMIGWVCVSTLALGGEKSLASGSES